MGLVVVVLGLEVGLVSTLAFYAMQMYPSEKRVLLARRCMLNDIDIAISGST